MTKEGNRVSTIDELTKQAKQHEASGDLFSALTVHDDILRLFEEDQDSIDDGAGRYVHVGDLRRQLGQPARAFAAYQRAAELYAVQGSAHKITELCVRMINVVPAAGDAYVRYARRLFDHEHVDAAVDVLKEFSGKAGVESVLDQVNAVVKESSHERRLHLAKLLDQLEENTASHSAAANRVSLELYDEVGPNDAAPVALPQRAPGKQPKVNTARVSVMQGIPRDHAMPHGVSPDPSVSGVNWTYVGGGVGVIGLVTVVVLAVGVLRDGDSAPPNAMDPVVESSQPQDTGMTDVPVAAVANQQEAGVNAPVVQPNPGPQSVPSEPVTTNSAVQPDPRVVDPTPTPTGSPASSTGADTSSAPANVGIITEPMVVESLTVQSVEQVSFRGQQGFRVVHVLDSGAEFIVESYPVDSSSASSYPIGTVIVNVVPPDTIVSVVRPDEEHLVFARGVVPEDSARILIRQLRVRSPSNN